MLDRLARRYGQRPSALLHGSIADLTIDMFVAAAGEDLSDSIMRDIVAHKGMVFPVREI